VVIDVDQINTRYTAQARSAASAGLRMPYTIAESIANTVAHELAHGINVNHHGRPLAVPDFEVPAKSVDIYHVFASDGSEISDRPFTISGGIGRAGNDESGDLSCIMAYTSQYQWAFRLGPNGSLNYHAVPLLPVGKTLCRSNKGTGINANNRFFGDATYGDCMSQIRLRP
jgi:hypothetical protein